MKLTGTYVDGFLLPVPKARLEEYREIADIAAGIWMECGALQYAECAADDLSSDMCRSFAETAGVRDGETVIFAWAVFPDRAARDAANARIMQDERMKALCPKVQEIFECSRMSCGGFKTIVSR